MEKGCKTEPDCAPELRRFSQDSKETKWLKFAGGRGERCADDPSKQVTSDWCMHVRNLLRLGKEPAKPIREEKKILSAPAGLGMVTVPIIKSGKFHNFQGREELEALEIIRSIKMVLPQNGAKLALTKLLWAQIK